VKLQLSHLHHTGFFIMESAQYKCTCVIPYQHLLNCSNWDGHFIFSYIKYKVNILYLASIINWHPILTEKKLKCRNVCQFIKKEKLKYHMVISIQTLCCDTQLFLILANGCNKTKSETFKRVWILFVPTVYLWSSLQAEWRTDVAWSSLRLTGCPAWRRTSFMKTAGRGGWRSRPWDELHLFSYDQDDGQRGDYFFETTPTDGVHTERNDLRSQEQKEGKQKSVIVHDE